MVKNQTWKFVRDNIIGRNTFVETPFGKRLLTYADYTASGRGIYFIENYIEKILEIYGNTHTEDDTTGQITTRMLNEAETRIKEAFNAEKDYILIHEGFGSTGAIHRLQKILGVYVPPVLKENISKLGKEFFNSINNKGFYLDLKRYIEERAPVVFVGPYEHHSNEVTWRECFSEVIEINLNSQGEIDLKDLEKKVSDKKYKNRIKIGSFSACSNVTGLLSPVYKIAEILHMHDALAFFDFSASAPYLKIDINPDNNKYIDALFFSPHKFIGGPGSCGILLLRKDLYRKDLPPTCSGGGTVAYVGFKDQIYVNDIELREKPGTPGILSIMKAALAVDLKRFLGEDLIEKREREITRYVLKRLNKIKRLEILGNPKPDKRIGIISFNIKSGNGYLHPKFVVKLLNDLFGIQARAGCSCAGPYGHRLLNIDDKKSKEYRKKIEEGYEGIKPGWARVSFHYLMEDIEINYILEAIEFLAEKAELFLTRYRFNLLTGSWDHVEGRSFYKFPESEPFSIEKAMEYSSGKKPDQIIERKKLYDEYLKEAGEIASSLESGFNRKNLRETRDDLIPFIYYFSEGENKNSRAV